LFIKTGSGQTKRKAKRNEAFLWQRDGVAHYEDIRVTPLLRCEIEEMQARSTQTFAPF
jgi:hypothetical protein